MISLTRKQIDHALQRVEAGLRKYISLQEDLKEVDVSTDRSFQKRFNHFYRVRRNANWQSHFYELLESKKNTGITFQSAVNEIRRRSGRLEASFASKLVATIHTEKPVIDSFVLKNTGLKLPYSAAKDRETKICAVYAELQNTLQDFLRTDNGKYLVREFEAKFPSAQITKVKMVDFVLWQIR